MRRALFGVVLASLVSALAQPAFAHAMLQRASPRVGSVIPPGPPALPLAFNEGLAVALCRVTLRDAAGGVIPLGPLALAPKDRKVLVTPLRTPLAAGRYKVEWRVVADDTHVTQGDFTFTVRP